MLGLNHLLLSQLNLYCPTYLGLNRITGINQTIPPKLGQSQVYIE